jgi:hypothetical protein
VGADRRTACVSFAPRGPAGIAQSTRPRPRAVQGRKDVHFPEYPREGIIDWHRRRGLLERG